jgi:hypothetical protein
VGSQCITDRRLLLKLRTLGRHRCDDYLRSLAQISLSQVSARRFAQCDLRARSGAWAANVLGVDRGVASDSDGTGLRLVYDVARQDRLSSQGHGGITLSFTAVAPVISSALAIHAEKLHEDLVWRRVKWLARWLACRDIKATFFVYPFRALVAGRSIADRVEWLGSQGHEIAQHTHFYAGNKIEKNEKIDDFSQANIVHCLSRDFRMLKDMGFSPKGFTAGSWFINDTVLDTLVELGFLYDCSAQFPRPLSVPAPHTRWISSPRYYTNERGQLLCLPTTCSLGEWFKWGKTVSAATEPFYQIVCLHDYDLLFVSECLLISYFLKVSKKTALKPCASIAERDLCQGGVSCQ